ncbi:hypothetical protein KCU65_g396, partial [Aureobasidium melanogenum]
MTWISSTGTTSITHPLGGGEGAGGGGGGGTTSPLSTSVTFPPLTLTFFFLLFPLAADLAFPSLIGIISTGFSFGFSPSRDLLDLLLLDFFLEGLEGLIGSAIVT